MTSIVVFGATGYAGSAITAEALSRGISVTGVARDTSKLAPAEGLTVVAGDAFDEKFVAEVASDTDVIVVALHAVNGERELVDALPSFLAAAHKAGARLSFVGGAGSLLVSEGGPRLVDTEEFPDAYKPEALSHGKVLEALRASDTDVDWFYLSPAATFGSYNPGERTGKFRLTDDVLLTDEAGNSDVSGADFAIAYVDEIERPAHHKARFGVAY
jgi:putative NADH-flavin reductase